ncbi:MAG: hypothetical protein ACJ8NS_15035 [Chthoniobacterales bacterium]
MQPKTIANIFIVLGAVCILTNLAQKPLGLPDWTGFVLPVLGALFTWGAVRVLRRAKKRGDIAPVAPTLQQYNRRLALMVVLVAVTSLASPFYLPYTGITLPFPQLVICAIISCAICVAIVVIGMRRQRPKD